MEPEAPMDKAPIILAALIAASAIFACCYLIWKDPESRTATAGLVFLTNAANTIITRYFSMPHKP